MLEAQAVSYSVNGHALVDEVALTVRRGELLALVGPNGAGKSTLLALLAGDLTPTAGTVQLDGRAMTSLRPAILAKLRAVMPQQTMLQFAFTVAEVVAMGCHAAGDPYGVRAALDRTRCTHLAGRTFPSLSGGEQARVTLARVLAQRAPLLLLDEPTASLDLRHQELVLGIAREVAAAGAAVVAVLHDVNLAARHADRVGVLAGGRLVACGPPSTVLTEAVLGEVYEYPLAVVDDPVRAGIPLILPGLVS